MDTPIATIAEFDYERARRAYLAISFDPEKRGRQEQQDYVNDVTDLCGRMAALATSTDQLQILATEIERYKQNYRTRMYAVLDAKSRTASSAIVGPAKFPTRQMEKRHDTA